MPGTPTFAAINGEVVLVQKSHRDFGNQIIIKGKLDNKTVYLRYAHLNDMDVTEFIYDPCLKKNVRTYVREGQKIGTTGQTGNASTQPEYMAHLHFEISDSKETRTGSVGHTQRYNPADYVGLHEPSLIYQALQYYQYYQRQYGIP
jgi:murein DD-endopeptidase MepM/ murein hydrolase activator NlpD